MQRLLATSAWETHKILDLVLSGALAVAAWAALQGGAALTAAVLVLVAVSVGARYVRVSSVCESPELAEGLLSELRTQRERIEAARSALSTKVWLGDEPLRFARAILTPHRLALEDRGDDRRVWVLVRREHCTPATWLALRQEIVALDGLMASPTRRKFSATIASSLGV